MSSVLEKLNTLHSDIRAMGSLPLLPIDDLIEYTQACAQVFEVTADLLASPTVEADPGPIVESLGEIATTLCRAGDDLAATEILKHAAIYSEARKLDHLASIAHNLAGINLYHLGEYGRAQQEFDAALATLGGDVYGDVRSALILMNRANVLHDLNRFDESERLYLYLLQVSETVSRSTFSQHAPFSSERFRGMICNNIGANRNEWAMRSLTAGEPVAEHVALSKLYLSEASSLPLTPNEQIQVLGNLAYIHILEGEPDRAERELRRLAEECVVERDKMVLLPELYRYAAEACAAQGESNRAMIDCYRALESSLAVADRLQERRVVDTFVNVLHVTSRRLFDPQLPIARKAEIIESESDGLVDRLVDFLERKDWYTGHNHSKAVATLSMRVARAMCEEEGPAGDAARAEIDWPSLKLAAILHDIGKLFVPWSLLNKLLPLTEGERDILKSHPLDGKRILDRVGLPEIGDIVVQHHEMPCGRGYPYGITDAGLMGSIIAIADAFEAMTTVNRRYREPLTKAEALETVERLSGTNFDPRVARTLVRVLTRSGRTGDLQSPSSAPIES